jgi:hypothetical protein
MTEGPRLSRPTNSSSDVASVATLNAWPRTCRRPGGGCQSGRKTRGGQAGATSQEERHAAATNLPDVAAVF